MKAKIFSVALAASLTVGTSSLAFASNLTDIDNHWAKSQIEQMVASGAVHGYPDGSFQPNKQITRAEFVSIVNQAFAIPQDNVQADFNDVTKSDWYYTQVAAGQTAGYVHGYSDHTFKPNNPITREEAAAIVANLLKLDTASVDTSSFGDSTDIDSWAAGSVAAIAKSNIMHGYPDTSFKPHNLITRGEAVATLSNALAGSKGSTPTPTPTPTPNPSSGGGGGSGSSGGSAYTGGGNNNTVTVKMQSVSVIKDVTGDTLVSITLSSPGSVQINGSFATRVGTSNEYRLTLDNNTPLQSISAQGNYVSIVKDVLGDQLVSVKLSAPGTVTINGTGTATRVGNTNEYRYTMNNGDALSSISVQ